MWFPYETLLDELKRLELEITQLGRHNREATEELQRVNEKIAVLAKEKLELEEACERTDLELLRLCQQTEEAQHRCSVLADEIKNLEALWTQKLLLVEEKSEELNKLNERIYKVGSEFARKQFQKKFGSCLKSSGDKSLLVRLAEEHSSQLEEEKSVVASARSERSKLTEEIEELLPPNDPCKNSVFTARRDFLQSLMTIMDDVEHAIEKSQRAAHLNQASHERSTTFLESAHKSVCSRIGRSGISGPLSSPCNSEISGESLAPSQMYKPRQKIVQKKLILHAADASNKADIFPTPFDASKPPSSNGSNVVQKRIESFFPRTEMKRFASKTRGASHSSKSSIESEYFSMADSDSYYPYEDALEEWKYPLYQFTTTPDGFSASTDTLPAERLPRLSQMNSNGASAPGGDLLGIHRMVDEERKIYGEKIGSDSKVKSDQVKKEVPKLTVITLNNCGAADRVIKQDSDGKRMKSEEKLTKEPAILKEDDANIYEEMSKLRRDFTNLMKETDDAKKQKSQPQQQQTLAGEDETSRMKALETELRNARDALTVLKADRKRLKAEKFELLNQMKQLYGTIEEKEKELRTFIRSFEMRMRESEHSLRQVIAERDAYEREKWALLRHARDETERALQANGQLAVRDEMLRQLQHELLVLRRRVLLTEQRQDSEDHYATVSDCTTAVAIVARKEDSTGASNLCEKQMDKLTVIIPQESNSGNVYSSNGGLPESALPPHLISSESCRSSSSGLANHCMVRSDHVQTLRVKGTLVILSDRSLSTLMQREPGLGEVSQKYSRGKIGKAWTLLMLKRNTMPRVNQTNHATEIRGCYSYHAPERGDRRQSWSPQGSLCSTPLREESLREQLLEEVRTKPIENWKSATVLTWMDSVLGMGQYIPRCAENLKSGKILLDLNESEYESGLGISHPLHRKKLRLAVEERRTIPVGQSSAFDEFNTQWVIEQWLQDIGLPQYSETFKASLVDGRLLDSLTKKELEKHLGVAKKFHQASVIHAITLLKLLKFDRKSLDDRRDVSKSSDCDPIVWTNKRIIEWIRSIDLGEYAEALKESGVHGALLVLESSFTAETFATIMGIPQSRNIVRRHLSKELESLVQVARARYQHRAKELKAERRRNEKLASGGSLGRAFSKSFSGGLSQVDTLKQQNEPHLSGLQKLTLKGSLSRAGGSQLRHDLRLNSTAPYISSPMSPVSPVSLNPNHSFPTARPTSLVEYERTGSEKHRRVRSSGEADGVIMTKV